MTATVSERVSGVSRSRDLLGDLVLVRLLAPAKKPPGPAQVRRDLARLLEPAPSEEDFAELTGRLRAEGLLEDGSLRLTDSGRKRALLFLGVEEMPPRCNWGTLQSKFLVPRALGANPASETARKRLANRDNLAAVLLKRELKLPVGTGTTLRAVFEALVCREAGFPDETSLDNLKLAVLSQMAGSGSKLDMNTLAKNLPYVLLNATGKGTAGLRAFALRRWLSAKLETDGRKEEREDFDLPAFARTVLAAARDCPTGRYGDNKVFISHVWRRLAGEPRFAGLGPDRFKQRLAEANTANLLTLSRADLVSVMDPADVRESETPYLNAVFHFILVEKEAP